MEIPKDTNGMPFGFINVCKPAGITSTKFGLEIRRLVGQEFGGPGKKPHFGLGHMGTLDPDAQGVLPLAVGKATRLIPYCSDRRKIYRFTLVVGAATSTGDAGGDFIESRLPGPDVAQRLQAVLPRFLGRLQQIPPMMSALHHNGRRLYEYARAGVEVERPARDYEIFDITWLSAQTKNMPDHDPLQRYSLRVHCSEGTYIRSLCGDLCAAIGEIGHMDELFREASGPFHCTTAVSMADISHNVRQVLLDPREVMPLPEIVLNPSQAQKFRHGQSISLENTEPDFEAGYVVFESTILGVAQSAVGLLKPKCVFA